MSENFPFNNPLIAFLVKKIDLINSSINKRNYTAAAHELRTLTYFLDPQIKAALKKDIEKLQTWEENGGWTRQELYPILNSIIDKLYEFGYFSPQQFRRT